MPSDMKVLVSGTRYEDKRSLTIFGTKEQIWQPLVRLGGKTGWYYSDWRWELRGIMDRLVGGVGLSLSRRHVSELKPGDALDWWAARPLRYLAFGGM